MSARPLPTQQVQLLRPELASRRLRLVSHLIPERLRAIWTLSYITSLTNLLASQIYLGRVLTDGTLLVPWTQLLLRRQQSQLPATESVKRALGDAVSGALGAVKGGYDAAIGVKSKGKGKDLNPLGRRSSESETTVWLQCAVGDLLSPTTASEEATLPLGPTARPLSGFDRLAEAGFSDEDIQQVRQQFYAEHDLRPPVGQNDQHQADEDDNEHARAMEEQWLEGLNPSQDGVDNGS